MNPSSSSPCLPGLGDKVWVIMSVFETSGELSSLVKSITWFG